MSLYLLLFGLFLVQEPVSTDAVLLEAYQYHYNVWIIHLLFVVATVLDIVVGYAIGKWLQRRFSDSKVMKRFVDWARSVSGPGTVGEYLFLFVWSTVLFPFSAVIAPWLDIPFWRTLICMFIGDFVLWYGVEWLIVLGIKTILPNPLDALYGVVIVSLVIALGMRYLKQGK